MSSEPQVVNDEDLLDGFFFTEADLKVRGLYNFSAYELVPRCQRKCQRKCLRIMRARKGGRTKHTM